MKDALILAASYLGPEGFGNDQTGLRPWPEALAEKLAGGELDALHWSLLSASDPSRFLRMDLMCRLGFLATELLAAGFDRLSEAQRERTGVCVESFTGSLDTDIRFAQTPRPSLFAYTLPSTVMGEICIRHGFKGPVLSLITGALGGGPASPGGGAKNHAAVWVSRPAGLETCATALGEGRDWLRTGEADLVLCLSLEAMNPSTAQTVDLPAILRPPGWHAVAVLLGRAGQSAVASFENISRVVCIPPGMTF